MSRSGKFDSYTDCQIMAESLTEALERIAAGMAFKRFLLPDGIAQLTPPAGTQPCDRLLFVMEGMKREPMSLNGRLQTFELFPGDVYLVRKNVWEYCSVVTAHRLLCIVPRSGFLRVSYYDYPAGLRPGDWSELEVIHTGRPVPQPLLEVFSALGEEGEEEGAHIPHLLRAAAALALAECRRNPSPTGKAVATFDRVRTYIDYNFTQPVSRSGLAERFGLNGNYLSTLFRQMSGNGLREYIEERRFGLARRMLRTTELPIKAVAQHCGFSSEVYFIRRFRELYGRSPGRYRLEWKN